MVDEIKKLSSDISGTSGSQDPSAVSKKRNTGEMGKNEFLQLLVTQLKNQDPLEPMKNDQFAVNLAQFSQLEQLISINDKVGGSTDSNSMSLASYLGQQVTVDSDTVHVEGGQAGELKVKVPQDTASLKIQLLDSSDKVVETIDFGSVSAGDKTLQLSQLSSSPGDYKFRIEAMAASGGMVEVPGAVAGTVTGFVPGADPKLIVNGMEISPSKIKQVSLPPASPSSAS